MFYTVGEMAKILGVPASTLRYYDQEGLLPFVERSKGGVRMFTEADYTALMVIGCLKQSGLSIKEIKAFIQMAEQGDSSLEERLALFRHRKEAVEKQMQELRETLSLLEYKCWYYETGLPGGDRGRGEGTCLWKACRRHTEPSRKSCGWTAPWAGRRGRNKFSPCF